MRRSISIWLETDRRFTTLVGLIKLSGLYGKLNAQGAITFFAAPNSAFERLDPSKFKELINKPKDSLQKNIRHYIIEGAYKLENLKHGRQLLCDNGDRISVTNINGIIKINDCKLTEGNKFASNGIIHIVEKLFSEN